MASPGFEFILFVGAVANNLNFEYGFRLALMLACVDATPTPDQTLGAQMLERSKNILQETLALCRSQSFGIDTVDINLISQIASLQGLQKNYGDLEVSRHPVRLFPM